MKKIKSLLFVFAIIMVSVVLSGCQDKFQADELDRKELLTNADYPQGVVDGTVSVTYYINLIAYTEELAKYMAEHNMHIRNKTMDSVEYEMLLKDGLLFASEFSTFNPTTKADNIMEDRYFKINYYFNELFDYHLKFYNTKERAYASLASDANNNYNHEIALAREMLKKYEIE